jgi:exopolyphosphatase / guanosine-5'-triphosphate,3'-diphosphate pyrophosphatase
VRDGHRAAVAAVDCGTNSTRLLIADGTGSALVRRIRITRLGQDVDRSRMLRPDAVERTLAVLSEYRGEMVDMGVEGGRQVATSAVRDAANGAEFIRAASEATGLVTEILSGEQEARLSFLGATLELSSAPEVDDVVVDIGGGSTEIAVGRPGNVDAVSLDVGCVRLTERFLLDDPPTEQQLLEARREVDHSLEQAVSSVPALVHLDPTSRLIGLAGTVATVAALQQGLEEYDRRRVHHFELSRTMVDGWCRTLADEPAAARLARPGLSAGREDVIVAGLIVLTGIMSRFGFDRCLVSESDILDGLVASLLESGVRDLGDEDRA